MRNPNNLAAGPRAFRRAGGLASAAVFLSLAACTGDTLDNIQSDLANGEDVNINLSTNDDGDLVIGFSDDGDNTPVDQPAPPVPQPDSEPGSFQVTFTNLTGGQLMTPPVVALHDPSVHLFQVGEVASDEIQVIAEMGNNAPLVEFAGANPSVVSAAGVAGAGPVSYTHLTLPTKA